MRDIVIGANGAATEIILTEAQQAARIARWAAQAVPTRAMVDRECDRRTRTMFVFGGVSYQLDERSIARITAMGADARFAALAGAGAGNLRWADPDNDFGWIATDNSVTPMDAPTMAAFADAAKVWVSRHTFTARALKDMTPIPSDFADNSRWP